MNHGFPAFAAARGGSAHRKFLSLVFVAVSVIGAVTFDSWWPRLLASLPGGLSGGAAGSSEWDRGEDHRAAMDKDLQDASGSAEITIKMRDLKDAYGKLSKDALRNVLPPNFELKLQELGEQAARDKEEECRRAGMAVDRPEDAAWIEYLERVARALRDHVQHKGIHYRFHILHRAEFGAEAVPGGHIYVYSGTLSVLQNEAELAGLLGREIAHIDRQHNMLEIWVAQQGNKLLDPLAKVGIKADVTKVLQTLMKKALQAGWSSGDQVEADRLSMRWCVAAGYSPYAAARLWRRRAGGTDQIVNPLPTLFGAGAADVVRYLNCLDEIRALEQELGPSYPHRFYVGRRNLETRVPASSRKY